MSKAFRGLQGIQLNGYRERWFAAAGSLGFDGLDSGHPPVVRAWKLPFRMLGLLDPTRVTVITKTLTTEPRLGRLTPWTFWRAAWPMRPLSSLSLCNAVALTNPGIDAWLRCDLPRALRHNIRLVVSLAPADAEDATLLARKLRPWCRDLAGIQINSGCPNVPADAIAEQVKLTLSRVECLLEARLPVLVKLGIHQPYQELCQALDHLASGYELINAVPWKLAGAPGRSPLSRYQVDGAVAGGAIRDLAREALGNVAGLELKTPLIAGGGIVGGTVKQLVREASIRLDLGASAISYGTAYLWTPWAVGGAITLLDQRTSRRSQHEGVPGSSSVGLSRTSAAG